MTDDLNVPKKKRRERIEVLGFLDIKEIVEVLSPKKSPEGHTTPQRHVKKPEKQAKKFYINRKDSPVRNFCEEFTTREEAIKMFDKLLWDSWHACNAMEEDTREWFSSRVKEYQEGNNIDLICDCRKFSGNQAKEEINNYEYPKDCHGYTLKKYIEYLLNETK